MKQKKALITGGSGGIANAIREDLELLGYEVFSPGRSELDVSNPASVESYFSREEIFDVVINNAGEIYVKPLCDSEVDLWENVINTNLFGSYRIARRSLINNKDAVIINISSMSAYQYFKDFSAYASSKSAIVAMTKCWAQEGLKAYSICPGSVNTKFRSKLRKNIGKSSESHLDDPDMLRPEDISKIVLDILEDKYANGSSILIRKNDIFEVR